MLERVERVQIGFPVGRDLGRRERFRWAGVRVVGAQVDDCRIGQSPGRRRAVGGVEVAHERLQELAQSGFVFDLSAAQVVAHGADDATL